MNFTSLSEVIMFRTPYTTSRKNRCATEASFSIISKVIKCAIFENLLTTVNIKSQHFDLHNNSNTKTMDKYNQIFFETGSGKYILVFCTYHFPSWQARHPFIIFHTTLFNCGQKLHKYFDLISFKMSA